MAIMVTSASTSPAALSSTEVFWFLALSVVGALLALVLIYWTIRLAVRHGQRDAQTSASLTVTSNAPTPRE